MVEGVQSNSCVKMGYCEESKAYRLFDLVKQGIIYRRFSIFNENTFVITLLNSPYVSLNGDPLKIVRNSKSTNYFTS
jgi:hypothetical protein